MAADRSVLVEPPERYREGEGDINRNGEPEDLMLDEIDEQLRHRIEDLAVGNSQREARQHRRDAKRPDEGVDADAHDEKAR